MKKIAIKLIAWYQKNLSPDHSKLKRFFPHGYCRYQPTCSSYTKTAIGRFGIIKGFLMGFWRVLRCNPFSKGGVDDPEKEKSVSQSFFGFFSLLIYLGVLIMLLLALSQTLNR